MLAVRKGELITLFFSNTIYFWLIYQHLKDCRSALVNGLEVFLRHSKMGKFYVRFNCKTEPALRQQRWLHDSSFMEQLEKMGRNAPTVHTARLRVMCGWHVLFSLLVGKQPLPANSHGLHLPANIWISKRNDSHISVWYFLDQNCCTCAMRSVSSVFNTSQAAAGKCNANFVWNLLKGHFSWDFFNIHSLCVAWELVDKRPVGTEDDTQM